jgi:hypothetical protein
MHAHESIPISFVLFESSSFPTAELSGLFSTMLPTLGRTIPLDSSELKSSLEASLDTSLETALETEEDALFLGGFEDAARELAGGLELGGATEDGLELPPETPPWAGTSELGTISEEAAPPLCEESALPGPDEPLLEAKTFREQKENAAISMNNRASPFLC